MIRWTYLSRTHVAVSACEVPAPYVRAFLTVLVDTRNYYRRIFGRQCLREVECNIRNSADLPVSLWTNGADRVYLTVNSKAQLGPVATSGLRHIYGIAHELAHIVMYHSIINIGELADGWGEGWATYLSAFWGVPHLYKRHGIRLWPIPHNYYESDGPTPLLRLFENKKLRPKDPTFRATYDLYRMERHFGSVKFAQFFRRLFRTPIRADHFNKRVAATMKTIDRSRRR